MSEPVKFNDEWWQFIHSVHELAAALFDMGIEYELEISPANATFSISHKSRSASTVSSIDISIYRSGEYAIWHTATGTWKDATPLPIGSADCTLRDAVGYLSVVLSM